MYPPFQRCLFAEQRTEIYTVRPAGGLPEVLGVGIAVDFDSRIPSTMIHRNCRVQDREDTEEQESGTNSRYVRNFSTEHSPQLVFIELDSAKNNDGSHCITSGALFCSRVVPADSVEGPSLSVPAIVVHRDSKSENLLATTFWAGIWKGGSERYNAHEQNFHDRFKGLGWLRSVPEASYALCGTTLASAEDAGSLLRAAHQVLPKGSGLSAGRVGKAATYLSPFFAACMVAHIHVQEDRTIVLRLFGCVRLSKLKTDRNNFLSIASRPHLATAVRTLEWHELPITAYRNGTQLTDFGMTLAEVYRWYKNLCRIEPWSPFDKKAPRFTQSRYMERLRGFHQAFTAAISAMPHLDTFRMQSADHGQILGTIGRTPVLVQDIDTDVGYKRSYRRLLLGVQDFFHNALEAKASRISRVPSTCASITYCTRTSSLGPPPADITYFGAVSGQPFQSMTSVELALANVGQETMKRTLSALLHARQLRTLQLKYAKGTEGGRTSKGSAETGRTIVEFFKERGSGWPPLKALSLEDMNLSSRVHIALVTLHKATLCSLRLVNCGLTLADVNDLAPIDGLRLQTVEIQEPRGEPQEIEHDHQLCILTRWKKRVPLQGQAAANHEDLVIRTTDPNEELSEDANEDSHPNWENPDRNFIWAALYRRPFRFYRERYARCWHWGRRTTSGPIHFWPSDDESGRPTSLWKFTHGATGEVRFGDNPLEYWDAWDEEDGSADIAEPTPYDHAFLCYVSDVSDNEWGQPPKEEAVPRNRETTKFTKRMQDELERHRLLPVSD
ncbi:uncharacterized protein B0I36DRAFT_390407 [Microdochium trichocladiopsis]|uniref:Uncharacterized protein n=1 Tax=Microdochium trichocladiopsis TaxID=1682393 RepID=A0A9P8YGV9_9PEZI|nr:uncharacterized protein B0I36DRAFT_390407 [Microdochium trichocladiopsis]KAH7039772.1 hypothetical protein B0I36DRAFT_390407 [Microdochium trichocladiopsis]